MAQTSVQRKTETSTSGTRNGNFIYHFAIYHLRFGLWQYKHGAGNIGSPAFVLFYRKSFAVSEKDCTFANGNVYNIWQV